MYWGEQQIAEHYDYVRIADVRQYGYNNLPKFKGSHPTAAGPKPLTAFEMILAEYIGGEETVWSGTPFEGVEKAFRGFTNADAGKVYARLPYVPDIK